MKTTTKNDFGEKEIVCYFCNSDKLRARVDFSIEKPPTPKINLSCAECEEGGQGLIGLEITLDSMKFMFWAEDAAKKLEETKDEDTS